MLIFLASCNKDLGNYEYTDLDSITITGFEESYIGYMGQPLIIKPELKSTDGKPVDADDYEYDWFAIDKNTINDIGKRRQLTKEAELNLDLALPASTYSLYFRAKNKETGYTFQHSVSLLVTNIISSGWLVLNDINGEARLDMLNYNTTTNNFTKFVNLLETTGSVELKGKPLLVYYLNNRDLFTSVATNRVYVGTDQGTYSINNQSLVWNNYRNLKLEIMKPTDDDYHAVKFKSNGNGISEYMMDKDGSVLFENITGALLYSSPVNRIGTGAQIKVSKHIAEFYTNSTNVMYMYDEENFRLLEHSGNNSSSVIPTFTAASQGIFKSSDFENLELLYMECANTTTKQFYALFKNKVNNEISLLRFTRPSAASLNALDYIKINSLTNLDKADFYAVDPSLGFLMYSVDNKVYQFNPFTNEHKAIFDLGPRKISLLKYQRIVNSKSNTRYIDYSNHLMLCTYDTTNPNTSGKMELYKINLSSNPTLNYVYDGFGKIVDVSYRE